MFPASSSLKFAELKENELMKSISKNFTNILFSIQLIAAYCVKILKSSSVHSFINHELPVFEL